MTALADPDTRSLKREGRAAAWALIGDATPSDWTIYFSGDLATARADDDRLDAMATTLLEQAEAGRIALAQRRIDIGRADYLLRKGAAG